MKKLDLIERRVYDYQWGDIVCFFQKDENGNNLADQDGNWLEAVGVVRENHKRWLILDPQKPVCKFDVFAVEKGEINENKND